MDKQQRYDELYLDIAQRISEMSHDTDKKVGAVIVKDGEIVGRGYNKVTSTNDPTAHAEVVAIRDACHFLNSFQLEGCTIYSSCEPCPMCYSAIRWAKIKKIYYCNTRKEAKSIGFDDDLIYSEIIEHKQNMIKL